MSIEDVKELFSKRVEDSIALNIEGNVKKNDLIANKNLFENKLSSSREVDESQFASLKETDVGITEYLSDCKGFSAVIKQRFSDFHVHEIDNYGNIVYLTNSEIPTVKQEPSNENALSNEYWIQLENLKNNEIEKVEIDVTDISKDDRKLIHKAIKHKYGSLFDSNTNDNGDKKIMSISRKKNSNRSSPWYSELGTYLHFVLFKKNIDTADAINIIASQLRTKSANLAYAGTKDKRANTSQWVSMWHLDAKRLNGLNKSLHGLRVGNYIYKESPLKLGDLKGNYFEIALRNVSESDDEILNQSLNMVKENGFINYFGLQRFGNSVEIPTHEIGKALVKGYFKRAVELILKPRAGKMRQDLREARRVWWETRDANKALKCLRSKNHTIEGQLLMGLAKHGKNAYVNALDSVPRNVRLLYLHAYQSFIWNKILSMRIKKFGKAILEGDLILVNKDLEESKEVTVSPEEESSAHKKEVICLSSDDLKNYQITDIVHPLPGYKIVYPNNIIKEWYDKCLEEDGLTSDDLKQTVKAYSLSGTYRFIVKKMQDMTWDICHYSDPEEDLILSDLDKLEGKSLNVNQANEAPYKAVILRFSLDSSVYATMALREILKIDTSTSYQASLNDYSNKRPLNGIEEKSSKRTKLNV